MFIFICDYFTPVCFLLRYRAVEKRLLVRFKDRTPLSLGGPSPPKSSPRHSPPTHQPSGLETLLEKTHARMLEALDATESAQTNLLLSGSKLHASTEVSANQYFAFQRKHQPAQCIISYPSYSPSSYHQLMIMLLAFKVGWTSSQSQTFRTYLSPNVHDSDDSGTSPAAAAHECASSCRSSGWEECTDAALFALLRDRLKSGNTEQVFEMKDTQRLKKHLQQVFFSCQIWLWLVAVVCTAP
jgi:hypothetical protein